jgi:membrane dipeptidase
MAFLQADAICREVNKPSMNEPSLVPVFDGHNDSLVNLHLLAADGESAFLREDDKFHLDLPRAQKAGLAGGIFAICVPNDPSRYGQPAGPNDITFTDVGWTVPLAGPVDHISAHDFSRRVVDRLFRVEREARGQIAVVRTLKELQQSFDSRTMAVVLHFEGAEAIDPKMDLLETYYELGLRSLGIVWSRPNVFGTGVPFQYPSSPDTGPGLTDAGRELIRRCNKLGIMVDLAHVNEKGFWDAANVTSKPLVVSHAAAHALTPTSRNITDRQLDAIAESNGVVGITFCVCDIRPDGKNEKETPLEQIIHHFIYIAERVGVEHVAFGSDFDGATIPNALEGVLGFPKLIEMLYQRGFDELSVRKIAYQNWMRVFEDTWIG